MQHHAQRTPAAMQRTPSALSGTIMQTPRLSSGNLQKKTPKMTPKGQTPKQSSHTGTGTGTGQFTGNKPDSYIMAITENKKREVGIACLSSKRATVIVSQFKDQARYGTLGHFMETYPPFEILLPHTLENGGLHKALNDTDFGFVKFIKRQHFNDNKGLDMIIGLATPESSGVEIEVENKYLALAAFHALIKYTEYGQSFNYAMRSCRVEYRCPSFYVQIDAITLINLEIVRNIRTGDTKNSLLGVMNHCKTSMGQRLLRTSILQPLSSITQLPTITQRQDFVELLINSEEAFFELTERLPGFPDLEWICASTLVHIPKQGGYDTVELCQNLITKILGLKQCLRNIPALVDALHKLNGQSELSIKFINTLSDLRIENVCAEIETILNDSPPGAGKGQEMMQSQRCFAVQTGINGLLDVARQTFKDVTSDIYTLGQEYLELYELSSLKIVWSSKRGYHLQIKSDPCALPDIFIQTHQQGATTLCTTEELASLANRFASAVQEIYLMTGQILEDLVAQMRKHIGFLLCAADAVALLDMLVSFATLVSLSDSYVRPEFSQGGPLAVRQGRHPMAHLFCLEKDGQTFVPNNTFMGSSCSCCILTGPNMSGKSVYLRTVALIAIMGHTGSWVPAEYACLPPMDRIFSRVGTGDNLQSNQSTFDLEMREMAHIISHASAGVLVIIDELGRGTSNIDGVGIAWACCEYLISCRAITLFATHYTELLQLPSIYPPAQNFHMAIDTAGDCMVFLYKIQKGPSPHTSYGLYAAESMGFPKQVIEQARELVGLLAQRKGSTASVSGDTAAQLQIIYELGQKLMDLQASTLDVESLRGILRDWKAKYFLPSTLASGASTFRLT